VRGGIQSGVWVRHSEGWGVGKTKGRVEVYIRFGYINKKGGSKREGWGTGGICMNWINQQWVEGDVDQRGGSTQQSC
jgi:hypothetical protein